MASSNGEQKGEAMLSALRAGAVIPAHPLALTADRKLDERRQRALSRYYIAAGVGGLAVAVHTTQFAIHDAKVGLLEPALTLAAEEINRADAARGAPLIRVAGVCGDTTQAVCEATIAHELGYQCALVSLSAMRGSTIEQLLDHCRAIAGVIDLFGFYLQPSVGGIDLPSKFWHGFCQIENARAIKIAPFDRYRTLAVIRAVAESGRDDIALYTGNDDNIVSDLITPYEIITPTGRVVRRMVGGLLGHWAVWTAEAVELHEQCRTIVESGEPTPQSILQLAGQVTDMNAAIFDAANNFRGCIPGIHEILRRQGLLAGLWCLNDNDTLSPGQSAEIDRVTRAYPHLTDDDFVEQHLDDWLRA